MGTIKSLIIHIKFQKFIATINSKCLGKLVSFCTHENSMVYVDYMALNKSGHCWHIIDITIKVYIHNILQQGGNENLNLIYIGTLRCETTFTIWLAQILLLNGGFFVLNKYTEDTILFIIIKDKH